MSDTTMNIRSSILLLRLFGGFALIYGMQKVLLECYVLGRGDSLQCTGIAEQLGCYKPSCELIQLRENYNWKNATDSLACFEGVGEIFGKIFLLFAKTSVWIERLQVGKVTLYHGISVADIGENYKHHQYMLQMVEIPSRYNSYDLHHVTTSLPVFKPTCIKGSADTGSVYINIFIDLHSLLLALFGIVLVCYAKLFSTSTVPHYILIACTGSVVLPFAPTYLIITELYPKKQQYMQNRQLCLGLVLNGSMLLLIMAILYLYGCIQTVLAVYVFTSSCLVSGYVYRYHPVTDERTLHLMQWFLQVLGVAFIMMSSEVWEVTMAVIIVLLSSFMFPPTRELYPGYYRPRATPNIQSNNQMRNDSRIKYLESKQRYTNGDEDIRELQYQ